MPGLTHRIHVRFDSQQLYHAFTFFANTTRHATMSSHPKTTNRSARPDQPHTCTPRPQTTLSCHHLIRQYNPFVRPCWDSKKTNRTFGHTQKTTWCSRLLFLCRVSVYIMLKSGSTEWADSRTFLHGGANLGTEHWYFGKFALWDDVWEMFCGSSDIATDT